MSDFPRSSYDEVRGVVFFARMLDKIRLHAAGRLPADYNVGFADPTSFDARFCRFWNVDFDQIAARTLQGGSDEEIFDAFLPSPLNPEHVIGWNSLILKRAWRDNQTANLQAMKEKAGFGDRADILTYVDFHDAEEGRPPRYP